MRGVGSRARYGEGKKKPRPVDFDPLPPPPLPPQRSHCHRHLRHATRGQSQSLSRSSASSRSTRSLCHIMALFYVSEILCIMRKPQCRVRETSLPAEILFILGAPYHIQKNFRMLRVFVSISGCCIDDKMMITPGKCSIYDTNMVV